MRYIKRLGILIPFLIPLFLLTLPQYVHRFAAEQYISSLFAVHPDAEPLPTEQVQSLSSWAEEIGSGMPVINNLPGNIGFSAPVVMRRETAWNSFLWIAPQNSEKAALHSPVVVGRSLLGVIDYVGGKCCRVRLITDPDLHIALRAVRGKSSYDAAIQSLQDLLQSEPALFEKSEHTKALGLLLTQLQQRLQVRTTSLYLAKGQLCGLTKGDEGEPLLKGEGFQYDFSDDYGGPYDLRTGVEQQDSSNIPLILPGDILITSGLDGICPEGLLIGEVEKVFPLMEGATSYRIRIKPSIDPRTCPNWVVVLTSNPMQEEIEPSQEDIYKQIIEQEL